MTIEKFDAQDRSRWLQLRSQDITASDIGAICGEGLHGRSPIKVWREKTGRADQVEMTAAMRRGRWGEAACFEALADVHPDWQIRRAKTYWRDVERRMGCTPDGVAVIPDIEGLVIVQAKVILNSVFRAHWLEDAEDDITHGAANVPMSYKLQTMTETMLTNSTAGMLCALVLDFNEWHLRTFLVNRDDAVESMIRYKVQTFIADYIEPDIMPEADPERDGDVVKALYPRDDGTTIDLRGDNEIAALVEARTIEKGIIRASEKAVEGVDTRIKLKLGEHTYGTLPDGSTISWKRQERAGYSVEPISFRVLRHQPKKLR